MRRYLRSIHSMEANVLWALSVVRRYHKRMEQGVTNSRKFRNRRRLTWPTS